jgi:asparagine synthase (glutamine-hydrolysing)
MAVREIAGAIGETALRGDAGWAFQQAAASPPSSDPSSTISEWTGADVVLRSRGGIAVEVFPGLAIVADARIDNAPDLRRELGLVPFVSTEKLIATAYRRWNEDCAAHLEGDFAFAIWDAHERRLMCARDPAGIRPLYYTYHKAIFRFAQCPGFLLRAHQHKLPLRDEALADFLYGRVIDAEGTFYEGIKRLEPGHVLVMRPDKLAQRRYYELSPAEPPGGDVAEEFHHLLNEAVRKRSGGHEHVGALLSGGLDSSSIACLLRNQRQANGQDKVPVFSMVFSEPERSNERPFVDHVLASGGFAAKVLELDGYKPLEGIETLLANLDGPTHAPNLACMSHVVRAAANDGVAVLLDGHGGDEVVSHGYGRLSELAAEGAWLKLWREVRAAADVYGSSSLALTRRVAAGQSDLVGKIVARLLAPFDRASRAAGAGPTHLLTRDLIERSAFRDRLRRFARPEATMGEQDQHRAVLTSALQPYAFEVHAAFYRSMGVEARYPFWDRHLVAFCLGLPAHEKLSGGWSRLILRRAMAKTVPAPILARRDKLDFTVHLARGLVNHHRDWIEALLGQDPGSAIAQYCDLVGARTAFASICADPDAAPGWRVQMVWRAVVLAIWLEMLQASTSTLETDRAAMCELSI